MTQRFLVVFLSGALLLGGLSAAGAEAWKDFSADMSMESGGQSFVGKIYVSQDKTRMEMPQSIMVTRFDKKLSWMLMPDQKMYMEHPLDMSVREKVSKEMPGELQRKSLGSEAVAGQPAEKFEVRYTAGGREDSVYQWIGSAGIPLRVAAVDGSWSVEYRNLNAGPQDPSLFEIPAGYQPLAMPVMPGNVQAMMDQAMQNGE